MRSTSSLVQSGVMSIGDIVRKMRSPVGGKTRIQNKHKHKHKYNNKHTLLIYFSNLNKGLVIGTHYFRLKPYNKTFVGTDAVDWIMKQLQLNTRAEAASVGELLQLKGIIVSVLKNEPFADDIKLYRFFQDSARADGDVNR